DFMEYIPLAKCHYNPNIDYQAVYKERFNAPDTIHFDFQINGSEAFFFMAPEVTDLITSIYQKNEKYSQFENEIPVLDIALKNCLFREIEMTNEIEGVHSTRKELQEAYAQTEDKNSTSKFVGQMRQYRKLRDGTNSNFPKDCHELRAIYENLLYQDVLREDPENKLDGEIFRKGSVYVGGANGPEHSGVLPEKEIIRILETSLQILNQPNIDPLLHASLFHFIMGYVHPFYDGNGRLARYLSQIKLAEVLKIAGVLNLSLAIRQARQKYYKVFSECEKIWNKGDLTPFVISFLEFIDSAMENGLLIVEEFHHRYNSGLEAIQKISHTKSDFLFLEYMLRNSLFGGVLLTRKEISAGIGRSPNTVSKLLNKYSSYIFKHTRHRAYSYYLELNKIFALI
ncbi:MAG: Fic family protein, partial [Allobaculum sp.]|nr:Fic family protein [Allobaculum sp.]